MRAWKVSAYEHEAPKVRHHQLTSTDNVRRTQSRVWGNLNLHGVTKSITFPATITAEPGAVTVNSTFALNRKDFGINYAGGADNLIRDEVVMTLKVRGVK